MFYYKIYNYMKKWFKVTVKAKAVTPKGTERKVTEQYAIDALSYTEAEARAMEIMKDFHNDFEIAKIDPMKVSEMFLCEDGGCGDRYFKCKVNYITLDEKSGKEKKTPCYMYVQANDTKSAEANLVAGMKGSMADWSCEAIVETKIIDVYPYDYKEKAEQLS